MSILSLAELLDIETQEGVRLRHEVGRLATLVDYDRLRLIIHIRRLEQGVERLCGFLRRRNHETKATELVDKYFERFDYEDRNEQLAEDKAALVDVIKDAFERGASSVTQVTSIRWNFRPMPPLASGDPPPRVAERYLEQRDRGVDSQAAFAFAIGKDGR